MASVSAFVDVFNQSGPGPWVLACDHASNEIPAEFSNLGLEPALLTEHIAWDPGARAVGEEMARRLDGPLIAPRVSRLVHDCNRPAGSAEAVPSASAGIEIPGNRNLSPEVRMDRARRFCEPFHDAVETAIRRRIDAGLSPILVTVHSFTPAYQGKIRDVELGVVHDADPRLANALLKIAEESGELAARRNDPYGPADGVTHTLRRHALPLGLLNVMLEIRNDLIGGPADQRRMADRLVTYLGQALTRMTPRPGTARHV